MSQDQVLDMIAEEDMLIRGNEDELVKSQSLYDSLVDKFLVR